jgi:DNA-binding transcriptional LysR family regulator
MLDWDKLRIFFSVAQAQSLTRGGESLGLSQSAVSRQISALEDSLQVTLFHRHARGLILTEQGEILYQTVADVFNRLSATETALMESKDRPKGPLKVTAPVALSTLWLTPVLNEFMEMYPDITITLIVDDRELDLAMREADIALRLSPAKQPDLIQRTLMTIHNSLFASHEYLRKYGVPANAEELDKHRLIAFGEGTRLPFAEINWVLRAGLKKGGERRASFRINSVFGILQAAEAGMGIASLPDYVARGHTRLTKILGDLQGPSAEAYLTYPVELRNSKRVKVFRDFLQRKVAENDF